MPGLLPRWPAAASPVAVLLLLLIAGALVAVDAFAPPGLPRGFDSRRQLIGIDLLLILVPPYLIFAWGLLERRSRTLLRQVDELLPRPGFEQRAPTPARTLLAGAAAGTLYAIAFNLPISSAAELVAGGPLLIVLVACMILVWLCVGLVLASRIHVSGLFLQAGRAVPVDLYQQATLEPFARAGMGDMLLTAGALVVSTVQSIDATFRYENYLYSLAVAVPAAVGLLLRPMLSVHARLKARRRAELAAVEALIATAPRELDEASVARLEALLKRRERAAEASTWPLNVVMVYRLLLYGVMPPAAWVAAALVEGWVEDAFGG